MSQHILITGGAGFIGSNLTDLLLQEGNRVTILDNLSTGRYENIKQHEGNEKFQFVNGSVLNEHLVDKLVERADQIYHLAAAVGVELVVKKPLESLITNIRGSEIVLEMVHRYHKKVLVTSTSEIYGKNINGPLKEDDDRILGSPLKSRWGYSTAKAIDELLAYTYFREKGVPTVIVRLFNTVGPRQVGNYGMVVPRFVKQALVGSDITVFGDGEQKRCFLHVSDAIKGLQQVMNHEGAVGNVYNIGNSEEVSMNALAQKVLEMTQSSSRIIHIPYDKAYEEGFEDMQRRFPSTERIHALTGWKPSMDLEGILSSVIEYNKH